MARLGIFARDLEQRGTRGCWYWGIVEAGRPLSPEEFRWPGRGGLGGAWFTVRPERARAFGTEIAAQAALLRLCEEHGYATESVQVIEAPSARRESVVEGGVLRVPLYHGTSDLFLDSIRAQGLGGADPLAPLRVLDFLRDLVDWCDLRAEADPEFGAWWSGRRLELEPTRLRESGVLGSRGGRTWLTPSRRSAARYALMNAYGSEALSESIRLFEDLGLQVPGQLEELPFASSPIVRLIQRKPRPILLQADGVALAELREPGDLAGRLDELWDPADPELFEDLTQQDHFELAHPIPASRLKMFRVLRSGDDLSLPEFTLLSLTV